jgi:hypothetical protein
MRWMCWDLFGRGENPYFPAFHVLAGVENRELP